MASPNTEINFKKNLLDENRTKLKKVQRAQLIVISIIFLAIIGYFVYQGYTQPKNYPIEVLPNTSRNRSDNANNFNSNLNTSSSVSANLNSQAETIKNNSIYYIGKIDNKIPFRVRLDYGGVRAGNVEFVGDEVYDGVSQQALRVTAKVINIPTPDYCPDEKCAFSMQEFDTPDIFDAAEPPPQSRLVGTFTGSFDIRDIEISKITGTFSKPNSDQKLKFELNRSSEFKIEDYLKGRNPVPVGSYSLSGNCEAYVEIDDLNECVLVDNKTEEIVFNFDKFNDSVLFDSDYFTYNLVNSSDRFKYKHTGSEVKLGKQSLDTVNIFYYFPDAGPRFTAMGLGTFGRAMTIAQFDTATRKLSPLADKDALLFLTGICGSPYEETSYDKKCAQNWSVRQDVIDEVKDYNFEFRDNEKLYGYPQKFYDTKQGILQTPK